MSKINTNQPFSDTAIRERGGNRRVIGAGFTASIPQFKIKAWDVTVEGYGVARYYATTRGKALADAWRCDAFGNISFGDFLKIASCWKAMFVPEGFGEPITVDGKPAFFVERNRAYVRAAEANTALIGNYHPSEVLPESYRPEQYRTTP